MLTEPVPKRQWSRAGSVITGERRRPHERNHRTVGVLLDQPHQTDVRTTAGIEHRHKARQTAVIEQECTPSESSTGIPPDLTQPVGDRCEHGWIVGP